MDDAAAFDVLCSTPVGYNPAPTSRVPYKQGRQSLPPAGCLHADPSLQLVGEDLNAWQNWREVLLCTPSEHAAIVQQEGEVTPFTDLRLVLSQTRYVTFIGVLVASI